jgi:hypothetical protein
MQDSDAKSRRGNEKVRPKLRRHSGARLQDKIDAWRQFCSGGANPESILTMVVMDSGPAASRRPGMTTREPALSTFVS